MNSDDETSDKGMDNLAMVVFVMTEWENESESVVGMAVYLYELLARFGSQYSTETFWKEIVNCKLQVASWTYKQQVASWAYEQQVASWF